MFWVKGRGAFGGRKGRRKSILRMGSRGRILNISMKLDVDVCLEETLIWTYEGGNGRLGRK